MFDNRELREIFGRKEREEARSSRKLQDEELHYF
jgi:hypothetical protein